MRHSGLSDHKMRICRKCLYPENHALGIIFDSDGVCSGCNIHDEKDIIDWGQKEGA